MLTVVLLPGMDGTGELFKAFAKCLQNTYTVKIISYPAEHTLDYKALAEHVKEQLPETPYLLLGESFSGPVAIALAASEQTKNLRALVLCATFARSPLRLPRSTHRLLALLPVSSALIDMLLGYVTRGFRHQPTYDAILHISQRLNTTVMRHRLAQVMQCDVVQNARDIQSPVLYLQASHERVVNVASFKHLQQAIPHIQKNVINAPHFLLQYAPEQAAHAVHKFIETTVMSSMRTAR